MNCSPFPAPKISMTEEKFRSTILKLFSEQFGIEEKDLSLSSTWESMRADSLDRVEMAMALEDEFRCEIPDEETEEFQGPVSTIEGVMNHMRKYVNIV